MVLVVDLAKGLLVYVVIRTGWLIEVWSCKNRGCCLGGIHLFGQGSGDICLISYMTVFGVFVQSVSWYGISYYQVYYI